MIDDDPYGDDFDHRLVEIPGHGVAHPDLNCEQQTEVFAAVVDMMVHQTKRQYRELWQEMGFETDGLENGPGRPVFPDVPEEKLYAAFLYGCLWQAWSTWATFAAELGIEQYQDYRMMHLFEPVPDDPSSLYE